MINFIFQAEPICRMIYSSLLSGMKMVFPQHTIHRGLQYVLKKISATYFLVHIPRQSQIPIKAIFFSSSELPHFIILSYFSDLKMFNTQACYLFFQPPYIFLGPQTAA